MTSYVSQLPDEFKPTFDAISKAVLGNLETLAFSWWAANDLVNRCVPGEFVEAGVYAGAHPAVLAHALAFRGQRWRNVHLFDSFEGIPHGGEYDTDNLAGTLFNSPLDGKLVSSGIAVCDFASVDSFMQRWKVPPDMLVYHKGWFQDTMPKWDGKEIAFLRLDGDLYDSTLCVLKNLYPHVASGGIVVVDDWVLHGCRKAVLDYFVDLPEINSEPVAWWRKP